MSSDVSSSLPPPSTTSTPTPGPETEAGVLITLHKSFGFIKSPSRPLDLFFHHSDLRPDLLPSHLALGLEVLFTPCQDPVSRRLVAKHVHKAAPGTAIFHVVSARQYLGQVVELTLGGIRPPRTQQRHRQQQAAASDPPGEAGAQLRPPEPAHADPAAATRTHAAPAPGSRTCDPPHAAPDDPAAQPPAPGPACKPLQREAGSTGILRYIPQEGQVLHLLFHTADVLPGCSSPLQLHSMVLFNISTDKRAAASSARSGAAGSRACHHAANKAVQVMVLDSVAMQYLEPGMQKDMAVLRLLGEAFPFGVDIGRQALHQGGGT